MIFIVRLNSGSASTFAFQTWRYLARDLAMCRITQLLIVHPEADLGETSKYEDVIGGHVVTTTFTLQLP